MASTPKQQNGKRPAVPNYWRIAEAVRDQIHQGSLRPGDAIPGIRPLAKTYNVSVGTVQEAVGRLIADGILRADGWRGTFVADRSDSIVGASITEPSSGSKRMESSSVGRSTAVLTIGIVADIPFRVDPIDESSFWPIGMLQGIERALSRERGVNSRFVNPGRDGAVIPIGEAVSDLIAQGVDGIALICRHSNTEIDDTLAIVEAAHIPIVYATPDDPRRTVPYVTYDNIAAGFDAGHHLLEAGYRKFLFAKPFQADWCEERVIGVREAISRWGLSADSLTVLEGRAMDAVEIAYAGPGHEGSGIDLANSVLDNGTLDDIGVIAANDLVAFGFNAAAKERGFVAGRNFGLVGFDDRLEARELGLTSVSPPVQSIGEESAQLLVRLLRGNQSALNVRLRSHVVARLTSLRQAELRS